MFSLLSKAIRRPQRIPPFVRDLTMREVRNAKYAMHRTRHQFDRQVELIHEFVSRDEFALVILDACRYDFFEKTYETYLRGELTRAWSPANQTPVWVPQTWPGSYDLTYVSANPFVSKFEYNIDDIEYDASEHFTEVIEAWNFGWDQEFQTTPPEPVTDSALKVAANSSKTRLVVHYIQPHIPYIGEDRLEQLFIDAANETADVTNEQRRKFLEERSEITVEEAIKYNVAWGDKQKHDIDVPEHKGLMKLIQNGEVTDEDLRAAYQGNLLRVLEEVGRLATRLECPVVVTSDHGDLLGEGGKYMHDRTDEVANPILREVPWLYVDEEMIGTRQICAPEIAIRGDESAREDVESRLSHLGYT